MDSINNRENCVTMDTTDSGDDSAMAVDEDNSARMGYRETYYAGFESRFYETQGGMDFEDIAPDSPFRRLERMDYEVDTTINDDVNMEEVMDLVGPRALTQDILTIEDEVKFWKDSFRNVRDPVEAEQIKPVLQIIIGIDNELKLYKDPSSGTDVFDGIVGLLQDLWKLGDQFYSGQRLNRLLDMIARQVSIIIRDPMKGLDVWTAPFSETEKNLNWGIAICENMNEMCRKLTTSVWPNPDEDGRAFPEGQYIPAITQKYYARFKDVLRVRALHKQLQSLLPMSDTETLSQRKCFACFRGLNPIDCESSENDWPVAIAEFENILAPAEAAVSSKLRAKLATNLNPLQLMVEFNRYKDLISRSKVAFDILSNREHLLHSLNKVVEEYSAKLLSKEFGPGNNNGLNSVVHSLYFVKQMRAKVRDIESLSLAILNDLAEYQSLKRNVEAVLKVADEFDEEAFDEWLNIVESEITIENIGLQVDMPVVKFNEKNRLMEVNFNPKLKSLIEDSQQLLILGFEVPEQILQMVKVAKKYLKYAQELDQIANFHNTIGDRILPPFRPVILDAAIALSQMVQGQNRISWRDIREVDEYTSKLKRVVNVIAHQNTELGIMHESIKNKVLKLFELDLFPDVKPWNDVIRDIRKIFSDAEARGYKNMKSWKLHWEHQVYKAMEVQYSLGLLEILSKLPVINIEITYRDHCLQFKPSLEDVRQMHYNNVRQLISIPTNFQGILGEASADIYSTILQVNSDLHTSIYEESEDLFRVIESILDKFQTWVALGISEIEQVCRGSLRTSEDWEINFVTSKAKAQEIQRLPETDEQIGCFNVRFALLRIEIELLNRKYWDILVAMLQNNIMKGIATAERYLTSSIMCLRFKPETIDHIASAKRLRIDMEIYLPIFTFLLLDIDKKNRALSTWTRTRMDIRRVKSMWETFLTLMENHKILIGHQIQNVKSGVDNDIARLASEIEHFRIRWTEFKPTSEQIVANAEEFSTTSKIIKDYSMEWDKIKIKIKDLSLSCKSLGIQAGESNFLEFDQLNQDISEHEKLRNAVEDFQRHLAKFETEQWIIFRTKPFRFEEFLKSWDIKLRNELKPYFIVNICKEIESLQMFAQNVKYIRGDSFTEKHWYELFQIIGMPANNTFSNLVVKDFTAVRENIPLHINELKDLNARAVGEITVRQALNEIDAWEIEARFTLSENIDAAGRKYYIIQDFKKILSKVGDNQSLLQSIRTSPFYNAFMDRISYWELRLADLDEYLNNMSKIQRRWIYLEPIFGHGVLDNEQVRFSRIDLDFRTITDAISEDTRAMTILKIPSIRTRLSVLLDQLSRCQNSLNEFLEKKRSGFPRFYFLGDDDLLEILGQSTKPIVIQAHLKKLFAGIYSVGFDESNQNILSMGSLEGEIVPLKTKVRVTTNVEEWLSELAKEMIYTLKSSLLDCVSESKNGRKTPEKYPAQILSLCNNILFTERCEEAIRSCTLKDILNQLRAELDAYTNASVSESSNPAVMELKLKDLILDLIHQLDVVECLIKANIKSVGDWLWQKQLRFYIKENGSATVKMADAEFAYSYEYQGNAQKLVYTPLIDKCFLTLTQGMRMGLGGNPYGPAGTGKTESVKALGGFLGRQVLVFNCDEGIDVKAIGRIFIGLVKCGAWGCFDEFNRLEGATLSAVSVQIQPIQTALKQGDCKTVRIMDETVELDSNAGIFVTLNPAGKGYGGRNKLPDNLKQLFRPVVMSSPDNELIAEVILLTEGFKYAKRIGRKLVEVYTLATRVLTPQKHYDWGLRALKTVLKGCGNALRTFKKKQDKVSEKDESDVVVSTLRLNTLPKLTYADSFGFDHLIKDVFADVTFKDLGYDELAQSVREVALEMRLHPNENQVRKCLELYEQLQQRMGVVVVGPPSCGKSTICQLLKRALTKLGNSLKTHIINPKAMSKSQLLGHINLDTRQWTDGVLTAKAQQVYSEASGVTSWIVLDGDIDPDWVESLNSVLDDNRLLTLPSGWRIKFGPNVNFLFETHDLSYASPATISRMGMIFMSDEDTDMKGVVACWLRDQPEVTEQIMPELIDTYLYQVLDFVDEQNDPAVNIPKISILRNALSQLNGVKNLAEMTVGMINGLGVHLKRQGQMEIAKQVLRLTKLPYNAMMNEDTHLYYDPTTDKLRAYEDSDLSHERTEINPQNLPLVRTGTVKKLLEKIQPWLDTPQPFVIVGPAGCGKTMILDYAFKDLRLTEVATIHCSSLIRPQDVIQKLSQICITQTTVNGRVYKPKSGDRLILYFKDINLVKPDKWGTCQLVELLHQMITYAGFYDSNLEWVGIHGIQIVASITTGTSAGRYDLSPRFLALVRSCAINEPLRIQLANIYRNYLTAYLKSEYPNHLVAKSDANLREMGISIVELFVNLTEKFSSMQQSHYDFTARDLTNVVLGMMRYNLNAVGKNDFEDLVLVYANEASRVFRDKLISEADKRKFDSILQAAISSCIETKFPEIMKRLASSNFVSGYARAVIPARSSSPSVRASDSASMLGNINFEQLTQIVEHGIAQFSRDYRDLNIVIFQEVLDNVAHIDRILAAPYSSLILIGRAGIGRKTAISIISTLHNATLFTLKVGRDYSAKQFRNDLKSAVQISAIEGNRVFLLVEDFQLKEDVFLDMLNSLLSSGEVPGLYTQDELETMVSPLRELAAAEGYRGTPVSFFAKRIRELMHVILIMDHTNTSFRQRCENNPAIYKQCTLLWLDSWCDSTLRLLPSLIFNKFYKPPDSPPAPADDVLMQAFHSIYQTLAQDRASPRRYVVFIHAYFALYIRRYHEINERITKLQAGVGKLQDARDIVDRLKAEAYSQEIILAEKQAEANNALDQITNTMRNANVQRDEMEVLREKTLQENEKLISRKNAIDEELKEIEPLIQEAMSSVGNIKNESLSEIRSLRAPPDTIRDILEGVLRLMGIMDMSWNSMKTFLAQRGVKEDIRKFDAHNIKKEDRAAVEKLLKNRKDSFEQKNAKRASAAAAPLASWVVANVKYSRVLEKIQPLETQQALLQANLKMAEGQIGNLSSELLSVDERVSVLKNRLNQYTKEAAQIEISLHNAKSTLTAAEMLVDKLLGEFIRWTDQLEQSETEIARLSMKCLLGAAFMTYLSDATDDMRTKYLNSWKYLVSNADDYQFVADMSDDQEHVKFVNNGLPSDGLSYENAIIIFRTTLRPYLIDPSGQAVEWLRVTLSDRPTVTISLRDPKFVTELELAVRFGKVLIVNDADEIEPILVPILRGDVICQGSRDMIQIADKFVDYNGGFMLFLCTRNPTPSLPPDSACIVTIVNFTTTVKALKFQLLDLTLSIERPELGQQKAELLNQFNVLTQELANLGKILLQDLANAQGDILTNEDLLRSLEETKTKSLNIQEAIEGRMLVQETVDTEVDEYFPLAEAGSYLYFAVVDIDKLNRMYGFSLESFTKLFKHTLSNNKRLGESFDSRRAHLIRELENSVYEFVCRFLFKDDRLAFALHLIHHMHKECFKDREWEGFTGQLVMDLRSESASSLQAAVPNWITPDRTFGVTLLRVAFSEFYDLLNLSDENAWLPFMNNADCQEHLPRHIKDSVTPFQIVMIVQTLRPDCLHSAMATFARLILERKSLFPPPNNLRDVCKIMTAEQAVLILTSPGADPSQELRELAERTVGTLVEIPMGQGTADGVIEKLKEAALKGKWVCLTNLHLVTHWLDKLDKEIRNLNAHPNFRLWLTTEPHDEFPSVLAHNCLKLVYEAPQGLKKNLQNTYSNWSEKFINGNKNIMRSQSMFALALFHAVIQERRTYIPQGWSKFYEYNDSDLRGGVDVLENVFNAARAKDVQWPYVQGIFENAIYGGRVDNVYDSRVLNTYLHDYFNNTIINGGQGAGKLLPAGVKMPASSNYGDYISAIENMSDADKPSYFGLPGNIERSWQRTVSVQVIGQLKSMSVAFGSDIIYDQNIWDQELNPILNVWKKINQTENTTNLLLANKKPPPGVDGKPNDPIIKFVELEFYNAVSYMQVIHRTLGLISRAVRGMLIPPIETVRLANCLIRRETPPEWLKLWDGPVNALNFLEVLVRKAGRLRSRIEKLTQGDALDSTVALSEFLNPESFLSAFKQQCARKLKVAMDDLEFVCDWNKSSDLKKPKCKLADLLLEGCSFDGIKLVENTADSQPIVKAPDCTIAWVPQKGIESKRTGDEISVPLYYDETRQKLIGSLNFPSDGQNVKWIQAGVGLFLE